MKMKDMLDMVFGGGKVRRYHTRDTINMQTNAEHSWGVASLIQLIKPDCSKELLINAMWHDIWEVETGDIPAVAKWRWPSIKSLLNEIEGELSAQMPIIPKISDEEKALLKMVDSFETLMFCEREKRMGNSSVDQIISNCIKKIAEMNEKHPCPPLMEMLFDRRLHS